MVYLEEPPIAVPEPVGNRGRKPTNPKTDRIPFRLDAYKDSLLDQHWEKVKIRKTAKGWLKLMVHTCRVWY
jgi:hypothetical protein